MLKKVLSVLLACSLIAALSVTTFAAGKNVKIPVNNGQSYTIPNVIGEKTYKNGFSASGLYPDLPKDIKVYTVNVGVTIDVSGLARLGWDILDNKNGTLYVRADKTGDSEMNEAELNQDEFGYKKGSYFRLVKEGYYLFLAYSRALTDDIKTAPYTVILHVVKDGSAASTEKSKETTTKAADKTTTTKATDKTTTKATDKTTTTTKATEKTTTTTKPADKNTVKIAGENRTPGEIQNYSSGDYLYTVKSGDTMYDLAKRFYGNGNLWKDLQKANQEYLSETKNGVIFVGFNLVLPAELGGVRAKV